MSENVELILLQMIKDSNMPIGAQHLSEKLSIPQASIGRLLLQLEKKGFLKKISNKGRVLTRKGIQYFSHSQKINEKLRTAYTIIKTVNSYSKQKLCEVLEIRIALESLTAEYACYNSIPNDISELEYIVSNQDYTLRQGNIGNKEDLQFHLKIAQMSKNKTLYRLLKLILTEENIYTQFSLAAPHTTTQIEHHKEIIKAIKEKDNQYAKKTMISHLNQVIEDVKKYHDN